VANELNQFIQKQVALGHRIEDVLANLRRTGWSEAEIHAALGLPVSEHEELPPAPHPHTHPVVMEEREPGKPLAPTEVFSIMGVLLIIAAAGIVLLSQWQAVSVWGRILFLFIPVAALFGLASYLHDKPQNRHLEFTSLATGSLLLPFLVGTVLFQLQIITSVSPALFIWSAFFGLVNAAVLEFVFKRWQFASLTLINFYVILLAALHAGNASIAAMSWTLTIISIIVARLGIWLSTEKKLPDGNGFAVVGTLATLVGLFWDAQLGNYAALNSRSLTSLDDLSAIATAGLAIPYLAFAIGFQKLYRRYSEPTFFSLRYLLENGAPLILLLPLLTNGIGNGSSNIFASLALFFSLAFIIGSMYIPIAVLLPLGAIGTVIAILQLTSHFFAGSVSWPIAVFAAGFTLLIVSLLIARTSHLRKHISEAQTMGLGSAPIKLTPSIVFFSGWRLGLVLVFGVPLLFFIIPGLSYLFFDAVTYRAFTESTPTPTPVPDWTPYYPDYYDNGGPYNNSPSLNLN